MIACARTSTGVHRRSRLTACHLFAIVRRYAVIIMSAAFFALWPAGVVRALTTEGVSTWDDLAAISEARLLAYHQIGRQALAFMRRELATHGRRFQPRPGRWSPPERPPCDIPIAGVYFVRCGAYVKIGHAKDIRKRLQEIGACCPEPLALLHHVACPDARARLALECAFHRQFDAEHYRGEWFRDRGALRAFLEAIA